jgi:hypothetical protein
LDASLLPLIGRSTGVLLWSSERRLALHPG